MLTTTTSDSKAMTAARSRVAIISTICAHIPNLTRCSISALELSHIQLGKADDPYLCPLADAIRDSIKCDHCEVWLDSIVIDRDLL